MFTRLQEGADRFPRVDGIPAWTPCEPVSLALKDGDTEVVADLLLGGHVPAALSRQQRDQPLGHLLLLHRKQVHAPSVVSNQSGQGNPG